MEDFVNIFTREMVLAASDDIKDFVFQRYGIEVDILEIAEMINHSMSLYLIEARDDDLIDEIEEYFYKED